MATYTHLTPNYVVVQEYRRARPSITARTGKYPPLPTYVTAIRYDRLYKQYTVYVEGRPLCGCATRKEARALLDTLHAEWREMDIARKPRRCWTLRRSWALRYNKRLTRRLLAA